MANKRQSATTLVPGAQLYYETQGSGPPLLLIPGGPQDAGVFTGLAQRLAHNYTVVSYDPRGNSRSPLVGEPRDQDVDVHGDDAARLIETLGAGPAYVFGTSGGGQIGLNLAARHPNLVRTLVAHEPACVTMLDDSSAALAADRAVYDTYIRSGVEAAMAKFFSDNALEGTDGAADQGTDEMEVSVPGEEPSEEDIATFQRVSGNFEYFLAHGLLPLSLYKPDVSQLKTGPTRVVVGVGAASHGQTIHDVGLALASALDVTPVTFPGDHIGFEPHAAEFGRVLHEALAHSSA